MATGETITVTKRTTTASVVDPQPKTATAVTPGPRGPQGDPGVHVGPTAPSDTTLIWVDTSGL
jgi:hypothetical protein